MCTYLGHVVLRPEAYFPRRMTKENDIVVERIVRMIDQGITGRQRGPELVRGKELLFTPAALGFPFLKGQIAIGFLGKVGCIAVQLDRAYGHEVLNQTTIGYLSTLGAGRLGARIGTFQRWITRHVAVCLLL